jgi:hypothetical protein
VQLSSTQSLSDVHKKENSQPQFMHPALLPLNEHNQKLRHQVHPSEWVNPQPAESYNLVVIGAGTAGLVTAFGGAGLGGKVALIERHLLGGDCLNVGCVPSKCLISPARLVSDLKRAQAMGAHGAEMLKFDFAKVMDRMREIRAGISPHDSAWRCKELGVDLFLGEGRFLSSSVIEVAGKKLPLVNKSWRNIPSPNQITTARIQKKILVGVPMPKLTASARAKNFSFNFFTCQA